MQLRLSKFFLKGIHDSLNLIESFDDSKFCKYLEKFYSKLHFMDQYKYFPPKFSGALKDLINVLGLKAN